MYNSIFDWEVRRLSMRERIKTRNDNGLRIFIFSQKLPFSVEKKNYFVESLTGKSFNGPRCHKTKEENSNKDITLVHLLKVD